MKFEAYILDESRGRPIDTKEATNFIDDHCTNALSAFQTKKARIFRGITGANEETTLIDPAQFTRVSRNTSNTYTLIIDNSPAWKEYPKRSKSIICTTDYDVAADYGNPYLVLPYDGSKIGVCPTSDIWDCTLAKYGLGLPYLNETISEICVHMGVGIIDKIDVWSALKAKFTAFEKAFKETTDEGRNHILRIWDRRVEHPYDFSKTFLENLQKMLDPKNLNFTLAKSGDRLPTYKEVWTDGMCVLVNTGTKLYKDIYFS
jgi:hypothetical protein